MLTSQPVFLITITGMLWRETIIAVVLAAGLAFPRPADAAPAPTEDFSDAVASRLLTQLTQGFITNNQGQVLAPFNRARMKDYSQFRASVAALFARYASFRAAYQLRQSWPQGERGVVIVEFALEGEPLEEGSPPFRRRAQLRFEFERGRAGWRIVDVTPRGFFS